MKKQASVWRNFLAASNCIVVLVVGTVSIVVVCLVWACQGALFSTKFLAGDLDWTIAGKLLPCAAMSFALVAGCVCELRRYRKLERQMRIDATRSKRGTRVLARRLEVVLSEQHLRSARAPSKHQAPGNERLLVAKSDEPGIEAERVASMNAASALCRASVSSRMRMRLMRDA